MLMALSTAKCETVFFSGDSLVGQLRDLSSSNGATVVDEHDIVSSSSDKFQFTLPRIEVQFLCEHDIRPEFNVSDIFASFFEETLNHYFNQFLDQGRNDLGSNDFSFVGKDDLELYSDLSISDIGDINSQMWYFPLCNESSTEILATMDVRGYIWLESNLLPVPSGGRQHQHSATDMQTMEYLHNSTDQKTLRNYFKDHVCRPDFFRSKTLEWDDVDFPPPSDHQPVKEYQPTSYHNSNAGGAANLYNRHHFFDHKLELLCGGEVDSMYPDGDEEGIDQGFLMLGIVIGMVMLSMICTELQQFAVSTSGRQRRRRNDGYASTTTREVELV
jgi:hypothetical protein